MGEVRYTVYTVSDSEPVHCGKLVRRSASGADFSQGRPRKPLMHA